MIATPVTNFLIELHPAGQSRAAAAGERLFLRGAEPGGAAALEAATASAYQEGFAAGRGSADALLAHERACFQQQQQLQARAEQTRAAREVATGFEAALNELRASLGEHIASLLEPLLARSIRADALAALIAQLHDIVADKAGLTIFIEAPEVFQPELRSAFEGTGHVIEIRSSASADVRVRIGQMRLETRIADWIKTIEAAR